MIFLPNNNSYNLFFKLKNFNNNNNYNIKKRFLLLIY